MNLFGRRQQLVYQLLISAVLAEHCAKKPYEIETPARNEHRNRRSCSGGRWESHRSDHTGSNIRSASPVPREAEARYSTG
ncbi:hypothetical protein Trydic_g9140 [Trypoxylus dichotomus]